MNLLFISTENQAYYYKVYIYENTFEIILPEYDIRRWTWTGHELLAPVYIFLSRVILASCIFLLFTLAL